MELEAISGAATIALASTIVFLLIAKTWNAAIRAANATPSFGDRILYEAAEHLRNELDRLTRSQSIYLGGALVFLMLFAAAYFLNAGELFTGYPSWQLYLQLAFLTAAALYAAFRIVATLLSWRRVKFARDASLAIGHQLRQIRAGSARVYHDIPTSAGVIDHVLIGPSGVYAINVQAIRCRKRPHARLVDHSLQFANGQPDRSIVDIAARTNRLQKEFRQLTGHKVRVRSVVALPGWEIGDQYSEEHLLVNERTIGMLTGWKDSDDYLMDEDVEAMQKNLAERCNRG